MIMLLRAKRSRVHLRVMWVTICTCSLVYSYCIIYIRDNNIYLICLQIIASIVFGAEVNSAENEDNIFHKLAREFEFTNLRTQLKLLGYSLVPSLMQFFKVKVFNKHVEQFVTDLVKEIMSYREANNIERHDLIDALIRLKRTQSTFEWDEEDLAAQAFFFYIAGLDSVSLYYIYSLSYAYIVLSGLIHVLNFCRLPMPFRFWCMSC